MARKAKGDTETGNTETGMAVMEPAQEGIVMMTPEEARDATKAIKRDLTHAGQMMLEIHDREGWRALGYETFIEWGTKEVGRSSATVYRYLNAAIQAKIDAKATAKQLDAPGESHTNGATEVDVADEPEDAPRGRGRPLGSRNRSGLEVSDMFGTEPRTRGATTWKGQIRQVEEAEARLDTDAEALSQMTADDLETLANRMQDVGLRLTQRSEVVREAVANAASNGQEDGEVYESDIEVQSVTEDAETDPAFETV